MPQVFLAGESTHTMAELTTSITSFVTAAAGWVTTFADKVVETPIALIGIIMSCAGFGVGLLKRLINIK